MIQQFDTHSLVFSDIDTACTSHSVQWHSNLWQRCWHSVTPTQQSDKQRDIHDTEIW